MKLQDICTVFTDGDWIESKDQSDVGIRLVQTGNIGEGKYLEKESRAKYVSEETFERLKCTEIFPGDILVSRLPEPVGRACIIPDKDERMITAVDCTICRPDEKLILKEYLCYFMQSSAYYTRLLGNVTGTTRKRISRKNLGNVDLSVPKIEEQREIVNKLKRLVSVIESRQKELQLLDELIKVRFVEMFGSIRDSVNITEIAHTYIGLVTTMTTHYCSEGTPLLFNSSIKADKIVWDGTYLDSEFAEKNKSRMHKTNDIITVHTGDIGTSAVIGEDLDNSLGFATIVTRVNNIDEYNPRYISSFLNYGSGKEQLSKYSRDVRNNLNLKDFNRLMVPKTNISTQNEYADFVKQVDKSKVVVQEALDKAQMLFDSLMQNFFG